MTSRQLDWKRRVAEAFDRAADSYEQHADVQQIVAEALAERIVKQMGGQLTSDALELGCGTGFLTALMLDAFPQTRWTGTDIAPAMVASCQNRFTGKSQITFQVADAEQLDLPGNFDLICCNLTFQWLVDLPATLLSLMDLLRPGGWLMFSTLAWDNFAQVYERFPFLEDTANRGVRKEGIESALQEAAANLTITSQTFSRRFDNLGDFLHSLKSMGAATAGLNSGIANMKSRSAIRSSLNMDESLQADYRILFVTAQRRQDVKC